MVPNPFTYDCLTLHYPPGSQLIVKMLIEKRYESSTISLVKRLLSPGAVFVDGGANYGLYSMVAAGAVGNSGKVFAFEPVAETYQSLQKNTGTNGFQHIVEPVQAALTERDGPVRLTVNADIIYAASVSLSADEAQGGQRRDSAGVSGEVVEGVTLDSFFASRGWPRCDVIKLDVEGHETAALAGMKEVARRNPQLRLVIEFSPQLLDENQVAAYFEMLQSLGLSRVAVIEDEGLFRLDPCADRQQLVQAALARESQNFNLLCEMERPEGVEVSGLWASTHKVNGQTP